MKNIATCVICSVLLLASCSKNETILPQDGKVSVQLSYTVDGIPFMFDSIAYVNAAGNHFEVTRLEFILSNFVFIRNDGQQFTDTNAYFIRALDSDFSGFTVNDIPAGTYTSFSFSLGLDSILNKSRELSSTVEFIYMEWPDVLGGGYHFMKLEGHFEDGPTLPGFAVHLGMNENKVDFNFNHPFTIDGNTHSIELSMNVNEWFTNPQDYDFNVDPNYTMSFPDAMNKIAKNGIDVFTLK